MSAAHALTCSERTLFFHPSRFCHARVRLQISVSEFVSVVKSLTGKRKLGEKVGGFARKQAYHLLRCVDKGGDRRIALRDLVAFVFATWTEELNRLTDRLAGGTGVPDESIQRKRRQLQKVIQPTIPCSSLHAAHERVSREASV